MMCIIAELRLSPGWQTLLFDGLFSGGKSGTTFAGSCADEASKPSHISPEPDNRHGLSMS